MPTQEKKLNTRVSSVQFREEPANARHVSAKVILLGAQGVGKTTILSQQKGSYLNAVVQPTIGVDFHETTIHVETVVSKMTLRPEKTDVYVRLKCFDTAGQERFKSIINSYYNGVAAAIIVFDITRSDSFAELKEWIEELEKRSKNVVFCILGNKLDIATYRKIDSWTGHHFASQHDAMYFETSAFRNSGIQEAFEAVAKQIVQRGLGKQDSDDGHGETEKKNVLCCPVS